MKNAANCVKHGELQGFMKPLHVERILRLWLSGQGHAHLRVDSYLNPQMFLGCEFDRETVAFTASQLSSVIREPECMSESVCLLASLRDAVRIVPWLNRSWY